jgi:DNA-binding NtrC family response regulator
MIELPGDEKTNPQPLLSFAIIDKGTDHTFVEQHLKEILSKFGYTVLTAPDGKSALEFYRKEQGQIDLVILDMTMPGMSGKQCLEGLLKINPAVKVVISSGYSHIGSRQETVKAGARSFIGKPYEMKQMLQVVREALDQD